MRAVKVVAAHRLELVDVRAPEPAPGEVVVRVNGCGICGSDLTSYKAGLFTGVVPGHELAGTVAAVGTGVSAWAPGDAAIIDPKTPCGACDNCRADAGHRCALSLTAAICFPRDGRFCEQCAPHSPLL